VTDSNGIVLPLESQRRMVFPPTSAPIGSFAVAGYAAHGGIVVQLAGELDVATVPALIRFLHELGAGTRAHLVVDLTALTFCDCAGLTALLDAHRKATSDGGWLRLSAVTTRVERLLKITGLSAVLRCFPTVADAFAAPEPLPAVAVHR
jgi:anti-sigma B factor antagonist